MIITSESHNKDIHSFFYSHREEFIRRTLSLIEHKYRKKWNIMLKRNPSGDDLPDIYGILKLNGATFYTHPFGIRPAKVDFTFTDIEEFLIINDLKTQKPMLIAHSTPYVIIYSTHAVKRFKERMHLDESLQFVDVCKIMVKSGCIAPLKIFVPHSVYGSTTFQKVNGIVLDGAYMGYFNTETQVTHFETFLSLDDLRKDQLYLDSKQAEYLQAWRERISAFRRGEITHQENHEAKIQPQRAVITGDSVRVLNKEEIEQDDEQHRIFKEKNPDYKERLKEQNRKNYIEKMKRKGYK